MQSPTAQNEQSPKDQFNRSNSPWHTGTKIGIDWRETGWFLERENDELAGYLFAEDCEMRQGSD